MPETPPTEQTNRPETDPRARLDHYDALEKALTEETWRKIRRYAARRCELLASAGVAIDPELAKQLVSDAVSDTAIGECYWDPDACALTTHLCGVIRGRTHKMILRSRRYRHVSLDKPVHENDDRAFEERLMVDEGHETPASTAMRADAAARFFAALYSAAREKNDAILVGMLDAYRAGVVGRSEVAEHLGIRVKQYDHARDRLMRLVRKLPDELRGGARDVMEQR